MQSNLKIKLFSNATALAQTNWRRCKPLSYMSISLSLTVSSKHTSRCQFSSLLRPAAAAAAQAAAAPSVSSSLSSSSSLLNSLSDVLVVSVEQAVAAPLASSRLQQIGARVLKIERPPAGDFARYYDRFVNERECSYFVWLNGGKESVALDLKDEKQRKHFLHIVSQADVFIQNLAPGQLQNMGIHSQALREKFPRLITCDISGYGDCGPLTHRKAYDLLLQAETGLTSITGTVEPARVGISVCDIAAGMHAYSAILHALIHRFKTGSGAAISVSLFSALTEWMNVPFISFQHGKHMPARLGVQHPSVAPYGAFPCSDGALVVLSVQNDGEFTRFAKDILKQPELVHDVRYKDNSSRVANRTLVDEHVASVIATYDRHSIADALAKADIAFAFLNDLSHLAAHPHLHLARVISESGQQTEIIGPAVTFNGHRKDFIGAVPKIGQHTEQVLREFAAR